MAGLSLDLDESTRRVSVEWTAEGPMSSSAVDRFTDGLREEALIEGDAAVSVDGKVITISFTLPIGWRENIASAKARIDTLAATLLPV